MRINNAKDFWVFISGLVVIVIIFLYGLRKIIKQITIKVMEIKW